MILQVPVSFTNAVVFDYEGEEYTFSAPRWNPKAKAYSIDIHWREESICGLFLAGGVNLLEYLPKCPLPSLWAYNEHNYIQDIDQETIGSLALVIRE